MPADSPPRAFEEIAMSMSTLLTQALEEVKFGRRPDDRRKGKA